MKISNKVRAEAIEFAGCMAWWWAQWEAGEFPGGDTFSVNAIWLATEACRMARRMAPEYVVRGEAGYLAPVWAEAQAMLLDGWTP